MESATITSREWYHVLVEEKTKSLSDFMASKTNDVFSDSPQEREKGVEEIVEVIDMFPNDFLHKDETALLIEFFLRSLESSALTGGAAIRGLHTVTIKSRNLSSNVEADIFNVLFKEGNLQTWPQKERKMQYDILNWLLRNRIDVLKAIGSEVVVSFIKSVSGERDPRCLVLVFSTAMEITKHFSLGPFTEDLFETLACYFPVQFKPQSNDNISRELLAATCASCLVSSSSFAPYCFMFIEEKLNDEECSEEELHDMFNLLALACEKFPSQSGFDYLESLLGGIRQVALNPKRKGDIPEYVLRAFESLIAAHSSSAPTKQKFGKTALQIIVSSLIENSEPFVLQAEMGLCKNALSLLCCAFKCLPVTYSKTIVNQTIPWLLNLVNGDSVSAAQNKTDITKEGLEYLVNWIHLSADRKEASLEGLTVFEQSIFASFTSAREIHPREALTAIYECSSIYIALGCASNELIAQCRSWIASTLRTVFDQVEFDSFLNLVTTFSSHHPNLIEEVLKDNPFGTWDKRKVLPFLCAISSSNDVWIAHRDQIGLEFKKSINDSALMYNLTCYEAMMRRNRSDTSLLLNQFETAETLIFEVECLNPVHISQFLQSIALLLPPQDHQDFINRISSKYLSLKDDEILRFDDKYRLVFLQNNDAKNLEVVANKKLSDDFVRQLMFASFNRDPEVETLIQKDIARIKAKLLRNTRDSRNMFRKLLSSISSENTEANLNADFEFLLDFESPYSDPEKCRYVTGSSLWRQRMFCQIVPIFKEEFDRASNKMTLVGMLPHLLKFSMPLDAEQLKSQFESLLPVLLETVSSEQSVQSHVTCSIPLFLKVAGPLSAKDLTCIIVHLCSVVKSDSFTLKTLEDALNSLNILVKRQPSKPLLPNLTLVVQSVNRILGHKKRFLRKLAADVKNNWEMLVNK